MLWSGEVVEEVAVVLGVPGAACLPCGGASSSSSGASSSLLLSCCVCWCRCSCGVAARISGSVSLCCGVLFVYVLGVALVVGVAVVVVFVVF